MEEAYGLPDQSGGTVALKSVVLPVTGVTFTASANGVLDNVGGMVYHREDIGMIRTRRCFAALRISE